MWKKKLLKTYKYYKNLDERKVQLREQLLKLRYDMEVIRSLYSTQPKEEFEQLGEKLDKILDLDSKAEGYLDKIYYRQMDIQDELRELITENLDEQIYEHSLSTYQDIRYRYLTMTNLDKLMRIGIETENILKDLIETQEMAEKFWDRQVELMKEKGTFTDSEIKDIVEEMIIHQIVER